jgi:hypothetical protein
MITSSIAKFHLIRSKAHWRQCHTIFCASMTHLSNKLDRFDRGNNFLDESRCVSMVHFLSVKDVQHNKLDRFDLG